MPFEILTDSEDSVGSDHHRRAPLRGLAGAQATAADAAVSAAAATGGGATSAAVPGAPGVCGKLMLST